MWASAGVLAHDGGDWVLTAPADEVPLPPTVQAIYAGQLDDLPGGARTAVRRAAVAGRRFAVAALPVLEVDAPDVCARRALAPRPRRGPDARPVTRAELRLPARAAPRRGLREPGARRAREAASAARRLARGDRRDGRRSRLRRSWPATTRPRSRRRLDSCGSSTAGRSKRSAPPQPTGSNVRRASRVRLRPGRRRRRSPRARWSSRRTTPDSNARAGVLAHGEATAKAAGVDAAVTLLREALAELRELHAEGDARRRAERSALPGGRLETCFGPRPISTPRSSSRRN